MLALLLALAMSECGQASGQTITDTRLEFASCFDVRDCVFRDLNRDGRGGAIRATSSDGAGNVSTSEFIRCSAAGDPTYLWIYGGALCLDLAYQTLTSCLAINCSSIFGHFLNSGGRVKSLVCSDLAILQCAVANPNATGVIYQDQPAVNSLTNINVTACSGPTGSAFYGENVNLTLSCCFSTIAMCSGITGFDVKCQKAPFLSYMNIYGNTCADGAIYVRGNFPLTVFNCVFSANTRSINASAAAPGSQIEILQCAFAEEIAYYEDAGFALAGNAFQTAASFHSYDLGVEACAEVPAMSPSPEFTALARPRSRAELLAFAWLFAVSLAALE